MLPLVIMLPLLIAGQDSTSYSYDALGRLTTVANSGGPCPAAPASYTYDAAGNRTNVTVTGASCTRKVMVLPLGGYGVYPLN